MITTTSDRHLYIGGSEANMIYLNYETSTFKKWWSEKLSGIKKDSFTNISMSVGTILEHEVLDLYESIHGVKGIRDKSAVKGIARANTDYILNEKVSDVKVTKKAVEWYLNGKVPLNYKRQLIHYMYVLDLKKASIIAYQSDEDLINNPFTQLHETKLFEIDVPIKKREIEIHKQKIEYLEYCRDLNIFPKNFKEK